ncbi:MAG: hypothetical protein M3447_10955 [Acidobacteriota bacterium]|nr:hypothetical protein [Acidobacteriota bacterium]
MGTEENTSGQAASQAVDDRGTSEAEGRALLQHLRDAAFAGSDEKFAIVLGRPTEEVREMISGAGTIDDDVVMKARGIAKERAIEIE